MSVRDRTLAGRYRLEEVIGRGGMSTVYRATDELLDRTVAVKVLLAALVEQDPTYAARFEREARAAAALASSTVATVYDTGVDDDGDQYIVMEFIAGLSLAQMLANGRPLETREAIRIAERIADALESAHAAGILHRDIKPANVMVADGGNVKLLDFGIARRLDGTTLTQAASVVGTAAYMAPERALGQAGDARADIYSLGCLLYAMLTGRPPFGGEVAAAVLHQQVNVEPTPPSRLHKGIPGVLDGLVLEMLAKAPEARPQSAGEVRSRLAALSGAAATAATVPITAATVPIDPLGAALARTGLRSRSRRVLAVALADHRWRAVLMGLATALVALLAVALLAGGGSHRTGTTTTTHRTPVKATTKQATSAKTQPKPKAPQAAPKAHPSPPTHPGPAGPPGPGAGSGPGPPGKHGHGRHGGGGDDGGGD